MGGVGWEEGGMVGGFLCGGEARRVGSPRRGRRRIASRSASTK